jgi:hypothetical protein
MREHSVSNASPKPLAMREHSVSNIKSSGLGSNECVSNAYAEALAEPLAMREHSVSNALAENAFEALIGKEKKLLCFIFNRCQLLGALETDLITTEEIRQLLEISSERLRNVIYRLSQKGLLEVSITKNGRSGWRKFRLKRELFQRLYLSHSVSNALAVREHSVSNASPKPYAEALAAISSSSSSLYLENLKTTTSEPELLKAEGISLTPEWLQVDFSSLADIGFTQTHLVQIVRQGKLTPQEVQDSIEFFTFDLKRNGLKLNGPALNFFMGILRKGIPYAPPENYESPADEARRKTIEFKARKEQERAEQLKQLVDLEFSEWRQNLSAEQIMAVVPEYAKKPGPIQDSFLKSHFEKEIWLNTFATSPGMITYRAEVQQKIEQSLAGDEP